MTKISLSLCILLPSAAVSAFSIRPLMAPAGYTLKETVCRTHTMQQDGFRFDKQPPHSYLVRRGGLFRIVFPDGRAASNTAYRNAKCAEPYGYILQNSNGKWGMTDSDGQTMLPFEYEDIDSVNRQYAIAKRNGGYGLIEIRPNGTPAVSAPFVWQQIRPGYEHYRLTHLQVRQNGKWGIADLKGRVLIAPRYQDVGSLSENRLPFKQNGKWGLADGKGRQILPPSLGQISDFRHGLAILSNRSDGQHDKNTRYGYIDRQGKIVQPARFTAASPLAEEIDKRIYGRATDAQGQHWKISPSGQAEKD